ncbi:MAG: hypothetical protein ABH875_02180 [Candidatus Omnitrophota bacterium]
MAISKGIVEMHKGNMWVESVLGEGTSFVFTIPKDAAETKGEDKDR